MQSGGWGHNQEGTPDALPLGSGKEEEEEKGKEEEEEKARDRGEGVFCLGNACF